MLVNSQLVMLIDLVWIFLNHAILVHLAFKCRHIKTLNLFLALFAIFGIHETHSFKFISKTFKSILIAWHYQDMHLNFSFLHTKLKLEE